MKIITILGARPQFIKAAAVSPVFAAEQDVEELIVHTGQHYDAGMSDVFFDELGIPDPNYHLGVSGGGHGEMTGKMLIELEKVILKEQPDWVMVYGDTNSTLAGALGAVKLHVPIAHVEAGLRSFNWKKPEEINRILTDHCSQLLLTPTTTATQNLQNEGVPLGKIRQVGDVMYDAALHFGAKAKAYGCGPEAIGLAPGSYVLSTIHRQENTDVPVRLQAIAEGLSRVAEEMPVVLPLHPRTKKMLEQEGLIDALSKNVQLIEPVGYLDMVGLQQGAAVIATDSGGVQKEAFFHKVPCVTLRDETEWVELVDAGWNRLVSPLDGQIIANAVLGARGTKGDDSAPYGQGDASGGILKALKELF